MAYLCHGPRHVLKNLVATNGYLNVLIKLSVLGAVKGIRLQR